MIAVAAVVGLAEGLAVGAAFVAFVVVLDIVPRLARLTGTEGWVGPYQASLALGASAAALVEVRPVRLGLPVAAAGAAALGMGLFVGLVSAALAEVIDVLPVLGRRLGLGRWIGRLVLALAAGKTLGAVLWWAIPSLWGRTPAG